MKIQEQKGRKCGWHNIYIYIYTRTMLKNKHIQSIQPQSEYKQIKKNKHKYENLKTRLLNDFLIRMYLNKPVIAHTCHS